MKHDTFSGFSSSVFVYIFSCIFYLYFFWGGGWGICLVFSTFLFLIEMYLELNAVRYPYHLRGYVIIVSRILLMLYIFQILNRNVFSFFRQFFTVVILASLNINFKS